jgi:hypothetical protein
MKWLSSVRPQAEEEQGFYMQTGYRLPKDPVAPGAAVPMESTLPLTTLPVKSVIARPEHGSRHPRGHQEIVGVAFSGEAPITRVEVSVDGGSTWRDAALSGERGIGRWQVFRIAFDASPGPVRAAARATDAKGSTQPEHASWNPSGYFWNAWHRVEWEVV